MMDCMTTALQRVPRALWPPLLLVGIYGFGTTSVLFAPRASHVAIWWPAAGLAVILLVLVPRDQRWWLWALGIVVSSGLANLTAGRDPLGSLGFGLSNTAEAVIVARWLCRGRPGVPRLVSLEDLWRLLTGVVLGILAIGVGAGLTVSATVDGGSFLQAAATVFMSHSSAILVIVPLALARDGTPARAGGREIAAQALVLVAVVGVVFGPEPVFGFGFLTMPVLVWGTLRLGIRLAVWELVFVAIASTALTAYGWGPFVFGPGSRVPNSLATGPLVQAYIIACAVIVLPLAVAGEQRAAALAQLSASEQLFRRSFTDSIIGMLLVRLDGGRLKVVEANLTAAALMGSSPGTLEGTDVGAMMTLSTDLEPVLRELAAGARDGWRGEVGLHRDPHVRLDVSISPLSLREEQPRFTVQVVDVTVAHEATLRMRSEMEFTAAILDTTGCLIVVVDVNGTVVGINRAAQMVTGYTDDQVVDRPLWETLIPPSDRVDVRTMYARGRGRGIPLTHEGDLATRAGRKRRVLWTSAFLSDDDGRRTHVVMTGIDVTNERTTSLMLTHLMEAATTTAFIGCDLEGRITVFNAGAQQMLGYRTEDVLGRNLVGTILDPVEVGDLELAGSMRPHTQDWTVARSDGSRFTMQLTVTRVFDGANEHMGYLGVGKDVTEARRSEAALVAALDKERVAVEQMRNLDRAKDDFVSTVSHELRTPITSIVGYVEMLQDGDAGELTAEQNRLVEVVRRNGQRLISLAEDLLTLSSFDSGTAALERVMTDVRAVVRRAEEALQPSVTARALDVDFDVPGEPVTVLGDAGHLERVVFNLVSNAVKFTEDGGRVRCVLRVEDTQAVLQVSDTGIGIPLAEQDGLFTRFFRSSTAQERAIQGTGLGLSIVDSIVRSHGGTVTVDSEHLKGTAFTVRIPLADAGAHRQSPSRLGL